MLPIVAGSGEFTYQDKARYAWACFLGFMDWQVILSISDNY